MVRVADILRMCRRETGSEDRSLSTAEITAGRLDDLKHKIMESVSRSYVVEGNGKFDQNELQIDIGWEPSQKTLVKILPGNLFTWLLMHNISVHPSQLGSGFCDAHMHGVVVRFGIEDGIATAVELPEERMTKLSEMEKHGMDMTAGDVEQDEDLITEESEIKADGGAISAQIDPVAAYLSIMEVGENRLGLHGDGAVIFNGRELTAMHEVQHAIKMMHAEFIESGDKQTQVVQKAETVLSEKTEEVEIAMPKTVQDGLGRTWTVEDIIGRGLNHFWLVVSFVDAVGTHGHVDQKKTTKMAIVSYNPDTKLAFEMSIGS